MTALLSEVSVVALSAEGLLVAIGEDFLFEVVHVLGSEVIDVFFLECTAHQVSCNHLGLLYSLFRKLVEFIGTCKVLFPVSIGEHSSQICLRPFRVGVVVLVMEADTRREVLVMG